MNSYNCCSFVSSYDSNSQQKIVHSYYDIDVTVFHLIDNLLWGEVDGSYLQGRFSCLTVKSCTVISSDSNANHTKALQQKMDLFWRNLTISHSYTSLNSSDSYRDSGQTSNDYNISNRRKKELKNINSKTDKSIVTITLYNIHTWGIYSKWPHGPNHSLFPTDYSLVESEESVTRFKKLFANSFKLYDGNSTTSPFSTIQRFYVSNSIDSKVNVNSNSNDIDSIATKVSNRIMANNSSLYLNNQQLLPLKNYEDLIKGGVFIASTCHRGSNNFRMQLVRELQQHLRIDSLGKCSTTKHIKENIKLLVGKTALESLQLKQKVISNYMFYLAFENSYERGYVTEKVFDGLIAGTVPIYFGPKVDCVQLIPNDTAVIFMDDYLLSRKDQPSMQSDNLSVDRYNIVRLLSDLKYLIDNQDKYEERRQWRLYYSSHRQSSLLEKSWPCRICEWGAKKKLSQNYRHH